MNSFRVEFRDAGTLLSLMGSYYPCLPRIIHSSRVRSEYTFALAPSEGIAVADAVRRFGPLPAEVVCAMVVRMAAQLREFTTTFPAATRFIDLGKCKIAPWQGEFIHLALDEFSPDHDRDSWRPSRVTAGLIDLGKMLLGGACGETIPSGIQNQLPAALVALFRQSPEAISLEKIESTMISSVADITRRLKNTRLHEHLMQGARMKGWSSLCPTVELNVRNGAEDPPDAHTFLLSRILAHRRKFNESEVSILTAEVHRQVKLTTNGCHLDPSRIAVTIEPGRRMRSQEEVLDLRLDCCTAINVKLLPLGSGVLRSPFSVAAPRSPGQPWTDLARDPEWQLDRLRHLLRYGNWSTIETVVRTSGNLKCTRQRTSEESHNPPVASCLPLAVAVETNPPVKGSPSKKTTNSLMKTILITAGSGGTGKSTVARLIFELAQFDQRDDVAVFDCDALGNRDLQKIAPEMIHYLPIDSVDTMRRIVDEAMKRKLVLVDLPASCHTVLARDLNPEIIKALREEEHIHWLPVHPVTAKASCIPAIQEWRTQVFGDAPSILVGNRKDGPLNSSVLDELVRPQDTLVHLPLIDRSLAAALDASNCQWSNILAGNSIGSDPMFGNPLVRRQLKMKIKECESSLFPLLTKILDHQQLKSSPPSGDSLDSFPEYPKKG